MLDNVIVIPYRNRKTHWEYFLKNTVPLIENKLPNSKIVVVEQNEGNLFNRGAVLNIAFAEFKSKTKYYITNDIDINPPEKCIEQYFFPEVPDNTVKGIYTSHCNTLGGIIKISDILIHKINGFPNNIWGWGCEDKALQNRSEYYNIKKETNMTNNKQHPEYLQRFDDVNDRERVNVSKNNQIHYDQFKRLTAEQKLHTIQESGITNIKYKILEKKEVHPIVEWLKVELSE